VLKLRSGAPPASASAADTGTLIATIALPADWMGAAAARSKSKSGTWADASADASGTAGHFRIYAADGVTSHLQGTVGMVLGGADMILDNTSVAVGQSFTVSSFTLTEP
jgi:hypothetical protein